MKSPFDGSSGWSFYLSFSFLYGAALLRAVLLYISLPQALLLSLVIMAIWLALFLSEPALSRRWPGYFPVYLVIQTALTFILLFNPDPADFFALLFFILSAQVMLHFKPRTGAVCIAFFFPLSVIPSIPRMGVAMAVFLSTRRRLERYEGGILLSVYIAYLAWLVMSPV